MGNEKEIFEALCNAIANYDEEGAKKIAKEAVEAKLDLIQGIKLMSEVLRGIGERFHCGELFFAPSGDGLRCDVSSGSCL